MVVGNDRLGNSLAAIHVSYPANARPGRNDGDQHDSGIDRFEAGGVRYWRDD